MQRAHPAATSGRSSLSRRTCAVRCSQRSGASVQKQAVVDAAVERLPKRISAALAGVVLTAALVAGPSLPAQAYFGYETPEQVAEEKSEIEREEQMLEYLLQQQSIARQAKITSERQSLQVELSKAQETLEKKLTQEQVNLDAVIAKGDTKAAQTIGAEQAAIAEREQQLVQAAALVEAKIDREEMIAKAEKVAAEQALEKEVTAATALVDSLAQTAPSATVTETAPETPAPAVVAETAPETPAPAVVAETKPEEPAPVTVAEVTAPTPAAPVVVAEAPAPAVAEEPAPEPAKTAGGADAESINSAIDAFLSSF